MPFELPAAGTVITETQTQQASMKMLDESMFNVVNLAKGLNKSFGEIDLDKNGVLSRDELVKFADNPNSDKASRTVAAIAHTNFDLFKSLAIKEKEGLPVSSHTQAFFNRYFGDDGEQNGISLKDAKALTHLSSYEASVVLLKNHKAGNRLSGYVALGVGATFVVVGGLLCVEGLPAILGIPLGALGVKMGRDGGEILNNQNFEVMKQEVERRQKMLQSVGLSIKPR